MASVRSLRPASRLSVVCLLILSCLYVVSASEHFQYTPEQLTRRALATSNWWVANIARQGSVPYGLPNVTDYTVFRNVKDFGAVGTIFLSLAH
jgi:hypothetical protein